MNTFNHDDCVWALILGRWVRAFVVYRKDSCRFVVRLAGGHEQRIVPADSLRPITGEGAPK